MNVATRTTSRSQEAQPTPIALPRGLPEDFFPLAQFEEFYQEVVSLKSQLAGSAPPSPEEAHKRLAQLLNLQEDRVVSPKSTLLGLEIYRQAQRVMVYLADQIFSVQHWRAGKWYPLEWSLFPDQYETEAGPDDEPSADKLFFNKLDLLLQQREQTYRGLAAVYFYALTLRPDKKDRRHHRTHSIDDYQNRLFRMISHGQNGVFSENTRLFAQAYSHTLGETKIVSMPSLQKWLFLLMALLLIWIAASSVLWVHLSYPVGEKLQEVQRAHHR